jgi:hypothetical protein
MAKGTRAFFQCCGLLFGAAGKIVGGGCKVAGAAGDLLGHRTDIDQRCAQRLDRIDYR